MATENFAGSTWVLCGMVFYGQPCSLTRLRGGDKSATTHVTLSDDNVAILRRVARLSWLQRLNFVIAAAADELIDESWFYEAEETKDRVFEDEDLAADCVALREYAGSISRHTMTAETGSAYLCFANIAEADKFRKLSVECKSAVCAAVFAAVCPAEMRKTCRAPISSYEDMHWRELPSLSLVAPNVAVSDQFASVTVRLPKAMASLEMRATARSLVSHLRWLLQHAGCVASCWIMYVYDEPLHLAKRLAGLSDSLEREGWVKKKRGYWLDVPCFVLVCASNLVKCLGKLFEELLDAWKLLPREGCIMLRVMSWEARSGYSLLSLAKECGNVVTARELNLRGSCISERTRLNDIQELVAAMPNLVYIDLAYNAVGGAVFFDWLSDWLRADKRRTVDMSGTPVLTHVRRKAEERGLTKQIIASNF
jgi:hypothetical protein